MIKIESVLVGSDAEVPIFLADGTPFPVTGLVGGTKEKPVPIPKLGEGFFFQEDNVNAEFNIPPCKTAKEFDSAIRKALRALERKLPPTMYYTPTSATVYKAQFLQNPECMRFGCDPDYCVWTMAENPKPKAADPNLRTASGHIHVGWENPTKDDRVQLVKLMDFFLGYRYIGIDSIARRALYGKAGAFRPKPYGVEYRVLGNFWLDEGHASNIFTLVMEAIHALNAGMTFSPQEEEALIRGINEGKQHPLLTKKHESWNIYCEGDVAKVKGDQDKWAVSYVAQ